jgi:Tol biopolymer transport system component
LRRLQPGEDSTEPSPRASTQASSPRGTIAVGSTADFRTIFLISPATGRVARVRGPGVFGSRPDLSPDGRLIAVEGYADLWVFSRRGGGARRFARALPSEGAPGDPAWAPSGRELAFSWDLGLYTISASGGSPKLIFRGAVYAPDWSPAGDEIVFVRDPEQGTGAGVIHSVRPDGRGLRAIVFGGHPDVSPDGSKLAFARPDGVYVASMDGGGGLRRIVPNAEHPEWSPDGAYLAFTRFVRCSEAGCTGRVYVVRASGGRVRPLGPDIFDIGRLSWSR